MSDSEALSWEKSCRNHLNYAFRELSPGPDGAENTQKSEETTTPGPGYTDEKDNNVIDLAAKRQSHQEKSAKLERQANSYLDDIRIKVDFLIDTYLDRCGPGGFGKDEHSPVFEQIWDHISLTACRYLQQRGALPDSPEFASQEVAALLIRKQADYGHENIARFGRIGLMVRMHDKVARLENLHGDISGTPNNESIEDNLLDLIGYSTIGKMWEDRTFMQPLME